MVDSFNDPALDRLIEVAYRQNLPLQIAGLRILEARAQLGIAHGQQWPSNPGAIGGAQLNGINEHNASVGDLDILAGRYQVGFDALWEVDFWGKYRRGVKAAKATWLATVADYDDALVSLTAEVARTYAIIRNLRGADRAGASENVQGAGGGAAHRRRALPQRRHLGARRHAGDDAAREHARDHPRAAAQSASKRRTRCARCSVCPSGCTEALLAGNEAIPAVPAQVAVGVPAEMLRRRPDIRGAELRALAQCDRIGVAKTDLFPRLQLFGSVGTLQVDTHGAPASLGAIASLFNPGTLIFSIGASLFWPILAYPQIMNNVRVQDARFQELLVDYQNTVLTAAQEVEDGMAGFLREQEAAAFADNAVTVRADGGEAVADAVSRRRGRLPARPRRRSARCCESQNNAGAAALGGGDQPDRALQGARRRLGGAQGRSRRHRRQPRARCRNGPTGAVTSDAPRHAESQR